MLLGQIFEQRVDMRLELLHETVRFRWRCCSFQPVAYEWTSPHFQTIFLRHWRDDAVHAQVFDKLSVVIGDVPESNDGNTQLRVGSGIAALDAIERVFLIERGENAVAIVE